LVSANQRKEDEKTTASGRGLGRRTEKKYGGGRNPGKKKKRDGWKGPAKRKGNKGEKRAAPRTQHMPGIYFLKRMR